MCNGGHYMHMIHEKNESSVYANGEKKNTLSFAASYIVEQSQCMAAETYRPQPIDVNCTAC